ncbi:hypothetical protein CLOM_g16675 [Closterium sp. NIES-68]|nr:hypothetical protein CLOM_g16675 [Closterium sp. NIES-68]GJP82792.1 hypothetical protein CLOP_g13024 [Closterium sp. NIES-67]
MASLVIAGPSGIVTTCLKTSLKSFETSERVSWNVVTSKVKAFPSSSNGRAVPNRVVRVTRASSSSEPSTASASGASAASTAGLIPIALKPALDKRDSEALKVALECLKEAGSVTAWGSYPNVARRTASVRELTQVGIKNAEKLAVPSVRNDALFLATVVGSTSIIAVVASQLPGDWGFFVPYLVGGLSIVVLAVGSVAPGLLQGGIGAMAPAFSDYKDRVLRHEAGHFLLAYLLGLPPVAYSLDIGKEHTNLLDDKLQKKIYSGQLESDDVDRLAVIAMAGMAAEGLQYEQVLYAASLIKNNAKSFDALMEAMAREAPVEECIAAIETAAAK